MRQQHIPSASGQGDWDRGREEMDPRTGASSPEHGRPYQQSAPSGYPESRYQQQAQRDHPGIEYFSGSTGYGGQGNYPQQQQGQQQFGQGYGQQGQNYGGGSWSRSENGFRNEPGHHQQEAFQPGGQYQQYGGGQQQRQQREGYGDTGRWTSGYSQYGGGQRDQFQGGQQFQDSRTVDQQAEQFGQNFGRQHNQFMDQGRFQQEQFHGYGGLMSGQSNAGQSSQFGGHYGEHQGGQQSHGYGGFQGGQPNDYGNQQQSQFMGQGSHSSGQQASGGYGAYGAYQVGSQPQHVSGRSPRPPKDYARSDERIRELICEHLAHHHTIDPSEVSVQVKDGRVTLEGSVPDRRMKHEIEDVADGCWGVKDVDNRIRVGQGQQQSGHSGNLDNAAQGWLAVPADVLTGGASTEAVQGKTTRQEDMSTAETSGSGMAASSTGTTAGTGSAASATTIASGRESGEAESKPKGK